jgi:hypothetical protein
MKLQKLLAGIGPTKGIYLVWKIDGKAAKLLTMQLFIILLIISS